MTSPEGEVAWRARDGCGLHQGRIGGRSPIPSGAGGIGVLPSSRSSGGRTGWGCRPSPSMAAPVRVDAERLHGVRELRPHGIQVLPVVAKVEDVAKLFAQPQPAQPDLGSVQRSVWFLAVPPAVRGDDRAVGEGELVQVVAVPAGEGVIDRRGELLERYRAVANYRDGQVGSRSY